MAQYRLQTQHHMHDQLLEEGTIVGDGTAWPLTDNHGNPLRPSLFMEGLDDEAKAAVEARRNGVVITNEMLPAAPIAVQGSRIPGTGPAPKRSATAPFALPGQGPRTATGEVVNG